MLESKNIASPDDKRSFEHGELSLVNLTGFTVGRADFRPGWRWSTDVKPFVGTDGCQATHSSYVVSGRLHVAMSDGRANKDRAAVLRLSPTTVEKHVENLLRKTGARSRTELAVSSGHPTT